MSEAKVIFIFIKENEKKETKEEKISIQCTTDETMKDICEKFLNKIIYKNIDSLIFLYEGTQINFKSKFVEQVNPQDKKNIMNIFVYQKEIFISPKSRQKIKLNNPKLEEIKLSNDELIESINGIKFQIDNIIKTNINSELKNQLKNINRICDTINNDIKNNNEKINNLLNDSSNNNSNNNNDKINDNNKININNRNLLGNIKKNEKDDGYMLIKKMFSHLNEKIKLKIIKYNKNFQKKIDITLNNYKNYSKRYIIYENWYYGKEFEGYSDRLIYEGEYLNGERNGKGKEYFRYKVLKKIRNITDGKGKEFYIGDMMSFEGEYKNGKRNGKGKEFYPGGELKFEGEYKNGERNGKGIEYFDNEKEKFIGEYLNGERLNGKEYNIDGKLVFEGEFKKGEKWNGNIKEYYYNGKLKFEGEYKNGKKMDNGKNIMIMVKKNL